MWVLIDNIIPDKPVLVNLDRCTDVVWEKGTLAFETVDKQIIEVECEKSVFVQIAQAVNPSVEVE